MVNIHCTNPCIYENEGQCTLTHVTSASEPSHMGCAYFKSKKQDNKENDSFSYYGQLFT